MKKQSRKLVLAKETVKHLDGMPLEKVAAAAEVGTYFTCPDTWYQCSTYCG
ncbi:MAG TPA: hypothetical protein VGM86_31200 [Thermoanaerobaculia bacterium]|jgi:hypothetical protein